MFDAPIAIAILDAIALDGDTGPTTSSLHSALENVRVPLTFSGDEITIDPTPLFDDIVTLAIVAINYCAARTGQDVAEVIFDLRQALSTE